MSEKRILIVYASTYGQTEKVAARVASLLEGRGHHVDLESVEAFPPYRWAGEYDAIVVGGSVYAGRHQARLEEFVEKHRGELANTPTAFFSVSAVASRYEPDAHDRARAQLEGFLKETGWRPDRTAAVAGAFPYTRYGFFLRSMMKLLNRRQGLPTDTSVDHELTDWAQVERFAAEIAGLLSEGIVATISTPQTATTAATPPKAARTPMSAAF